MLPNNSFASARALLAGVLALTLLQSTWWAAGQIAPINGMRPADPRAHAITNATVIAAPGEKLENATIVIRNGLIEAVGPSSDISVPADARIWNGEGMTVYPGLIESALLIRSGDEPRSAGAHWNPRVNPERSMAEQPAPDQSLR